MHAVSPDVTRNDSTKFWMAEGLSNRDIGERLNIRPNTISDHLSDVMRRLEVSNRASAVSTAFRLGLLP